MAIYEYIMYLCSMNVQKTVIDRTKRSLKFSLNDFANSLSVCLFILCDSILDKSGSIAPILMKLSILRKHFYFITSLKAFKL